MTFAFAIDRAYIDPMLPTLRQLQYLKLLAEHGSFSRAAEAAHVTQPTLSAGIHELERAWARRWSTGPLGGDPDRRGRGGRGRAEEILAQAEDLVQAAKSAGQALTGRFRLGVIPTIAPSCCPRPCLFCATVPAPEAVPARGPDPSAGRVLKAGAIDAALIALPYDVAGLDYDVVGEDELLAMAPMGHPMTAQAAAPVSMLQEGLILLEDGHCLRDQALEMCGLHPPKASAEEGLFAATSLHTLVQMVGSGLGVSLLPAMAVEAGLANDAPVAVRPLAPGHPSRRIVVAWRAGSSREVEGRLLAETLRSDHLRPAA